MSIEGMFRRPPEDDAIPLLTEIIPPAAHNGPTEPTLPLDAGTGPSLEPSVASPVDFGAHREPQVSPVAAADFPAFDSDELRESLIRAVLARLSPRVDTVLDHRISEAIRSALEAELPGLRTQIHAAVTGAVNEVLSRAIATELSKLEASRRTAT